MAFNSNARPTLGPVDVATVETLLRGTGEVAQSSDPPTGLFSGFLRDATRDFQRKNRLDVDGVVTPEGETLAALEDEDRRARCRALAVRGENLRLMSRNLGDELQELSRRNENLSQDIAGLQRQRQPLLEALRAAGVSIAESILRGARNPRVILGDAIAAGAGAAAREFIGVQLEINVLRSEVAGNVGEIENRNKRLRDTEAERAEVVQQQRNLDCHS